MNIDKFKKDHDEIVSQVNELRELVQSGIMENATEIAKLIINMSTVIKLHLAAEDRMLYPAYSKSKDSSISKVGHMFQKEMGDIASAYLEFVGRWNRAARLSQDPAGFREEANNIFKALHFRIQRENKELYPLADRV
jgi:hemerythrin-like domain-containing protein